MHDYSFGNTLLQLRRRAGMTQKELAQRLNVTDKAVSKWENGRAKPTTDTLRKLAALLDVSPEDLLREPKLEPAVTKIVITGGPCAGKSTAMSWIQNAFSQMGYAV
ncbi:MAG: helix-turn-helix domain-containing protein, partial [Clostridia bacterium]|nr:helix-turn-helix domain-containing protein [Clostridia bacterium]